MAYKPTLKPFGDTSKGIVSNITNQLGLNAKAPATPTTTPTLPQSQTITNKIAPLVTTPKPSASGIPQMSTSVYKAPITSTPVQKPSTITPPTAQNNWNYNPYTKELTDQGRQAGMPDLNTDLTNIRRDDIESSEEIERRRKPTIDPTSRAGLIGEAVKRASIDPFAGTMQRKQDIEDEIARLTADYSRRMAGLNVQGMDLSAKTGEGKAIQDNYQMQMEALTNKLAQTESQLTAEQSAYGTQTGLLSNLAELQQPVTQFGMLTDPSTGQIIGGGVGGQQTTAQTLMNTSVQKAVAMINSGSSIEDAVSLSGLNQFGDFGKSLLSTALMGGGMFNPTAYGTEVATNQANLSAIQTQAQGTNVALQQIEAITPMIIDFLSRSGINPYDAQMYNGPVMEYLNKIGASGVATQWAAQMGDLANYTSQLIASGYAGTPTGAEARTLSQDPSMLSLKDLNAYMDTLRALGQNRLHVLQSQQQALGGTGTGYMGSPAEMVTKTSPATMGTTGFGTGQTKPMDQFTAGVLTSTLPDLARGTTQGGGFAIGNKILQWLMK